MRGREMVEAKKRIVMREAEKLVSWGEYETVEEAWGEAETICYECDYFECLYNFSKDEDNTDEE